jgi:hypothetical protein
MLKVQLWHK